MLAIAKSCGVLGIDGYEIIVEADVSAGIPAFDIVGLPDAAVKEARERVRAAIRNSGLEFPMRRITVNLAPADIKKEGAVFDLPIAAAILAATCQIEQSEKLNDVYITGELALDGGVRSVNGVLAMADSLRSKNISGFFVPQENASEAAIIPELPVFGVQSLTQLVNILNGKEEAVAEKVDIDEIFEKQPGYEGFDMSEVKGQEGVKRALEVAAAGGHNIAMIGPPGSGKTMLARRLPGILPPLSLQEALQVTKIYSVSGMLGEKEKLMTSRPFRAPHHGASSPSIIGGGVVPRPGEISLSSYGVLFMDEMPEFKRDVLEALRQPLEDKKVTVSRVSGRVDFPANFQLVGALNPCPCGYYGDTLKNCTCTPHMREKYLHRISGPLLDRIDLHVIVPRVEYNDLSDQKPAESSAVIRERVIAARKRQEARFAGSGVLCNAHMNRRQLVEFCQLDEISNRLLQDAFKRLKLSARAHDKILKVARTIADLAGEEKITALHIAEAVQYRIMDRELD